MIGGYCVHISSDRRHISPTGLTFGLQCYDCVYKQIDGVAVGGSSYGCRDPFRKDYRVTTRPCEGSCYVRTKEHLLHHDIQYVALSALHGPNQTWEIGRFSMKTRRYVGKR